MSRELKTVVVVDGVVYGPGHQTDIPAGVASRITNPAAWGEQVESDEGHGVPGDHEQLAAGLLPHAPVQPNQITLAEPAGDGGINPLLPASADTGSSAVPAGANTPTGVPSATAPMILTSDPGVDEGDAQDPSYQQGDYVATQPVPAGSVRKVGDREEPTAYPSLPEPPRSGKGATTAAWRTYAANFGVDIDEDADRGAIIDRLKNDGHIQ